MLENLEFLAILASRKAGNRKDIGTVNRIPKLDVRSSNLLARFDLRQAGPGVAKGASGPYFFGSSPEAVFGPQEGRLNHDSIKTRTSVRSRARRAQ
jgi:hypothetical protein